MRHFVSRIVATAEPRGNLEAVERLVKQVDETGAEAVVVLGSLAPRGTTRAYSHLFKALAQTRLPTFYLPGPEDVPIVEYIREAATIELIYPYLHGVHGTLDYQKVFLFSTPPEHKGFHESGSTMLAELIKSYRPRLVFVSGKEPKRELLGTSLVVMPGSLTQGDFSIVDLREQTVETRSIRS